MKFVHTLFAALLLAPVCTCAQATKTIPLGGGFGLDTKIPVSFDSAAFNRRFQESLRNARAAQRPVPFSLRAADEISAEEEINEADYTRCIVCREKIKKTDGYKILPQRDWYVKKNSLCACRFFDDWKNKQDLSFEQTSQTRQACEAEMDSKYEVHTCAVCGKPVNAACGSVSAWTDGEETHYAHADCRASHQYEAAAAELMQHLEITPESCTQFKEQEQAKQDAQRRLLEEFRTNAQTSTLEPAPLPEATVETPRRPLKQVQKDFNKFMSRHGSELQKIGQLRRDGKNLTEKQTRLLTRFNALHEELTSWQDNPGE